MAANKADSRVFKLFVNYKLQPSTLKQTSKITDKESENNALMSFTVAIRRAGNSKNFNHVFQLISQGNRKRQLVAKTLISYFCLATKCLSYFSPIV